jgi:hypothetical protein
VVAQQPPPAAGWQQQARLAGQFYQQMAKLAAQAVAAILALWQQLDLRDVRSSWPSVRSQLEFLVQLDHRAAAAAGQQYYAQARSLAGVTDGLPPLLSVPAPPADLVQATLDSTGPYALLGRIKQAQPLQRANETTGVTLSGAASRLITNGARQAVMSSVKADAQAVAWMRVTSGDPCAFCAMLASRGPVFKSQQAAGFLAHDHCRCVAAAVFSDQDAEKLKDNDLSQQWKQVTKGLSGADARREWRRQWDAQHNRDGVRALPSPAA